MSTRTLTGIRPSLWARCVTAAVFQGRGHEEAEHPAEAQEWFFRGHVFEDIVMRQILAKHDPAALRHYNLTSVWKSDVVQRQVVIPIPGIGEGHADGYLIPEKALIEVKSTVAAYPNSDTFTFGVEQLKRYLAYHGEAEKGYLYMVDPSRMKPADVYEVRLFGGDSESIEYERQTIELLVDNGAALDAHGTVYRPCTRPQQARTRMCPFAHVCFSDWQPDPAAEVTDPVALNAASRLHAIKTEKAQLAAQVRALEEGEKAAAAELAEYVDPGEAIVGPFAVKRTHVEMQPRFSIRAFEAAGHSIEPLSEFFTPGSEYDKWTIRPAEKPGDVEYGDVPF